MSHDNTAEQLRNALLRRITKQFDKSDWIALGLEVGMVDAIQKHDRLLRSLDWGDDDYAGHAVKFGGDALDKLGLPSSSHSNSSSNVSADLLAKIEKVFRTSYWLESEEPELYSELYQSQGAVDATAGLEKAAQRLSIKEVDEHSRRIREGLINDPHQAIGQAKDLLETICKEILGLHGNDKASRAKDLPELIKDVKAELKLEVSGKPGDEHRVRIYSALTQITAAAAELRNLGLGTGHGVARGPKADAILAELVVTSVAGVCHFLLATFEAQPAQTSK
ncbi:abortive infection family protein [Pseudarthrobacter sp. lyk4-40-TYG-27]|uniref:abortive infection family protein n=1 Tax=Pseudarthrobacter sp. lyk4-40-TYG-27 TaxID=3040305 RepID=UPI002553F82C|nr:abortive infection family protein [Pseudarthrobacter sp. lyk4-40-TYG-27]